MVATRRAFKHEGATLSRWPALEVNQVVLDAAARTLFQQPYGIPFSAESTYLVHGFCEHILPSFSYPAEDTLAGAEPDEQILGVNPRALGMMKLSVFPSLDIRALPIL